MLIEVLYVPDCCNHEPTMNRVRAVLRAEGLELPVAEIAVAEPVAARSLKFPGSPTVRVNGIDVESCDAESSGQSAFGLTCRLYPDGSGLPSVAALRRAISAARNQS
jgi:hypothetical protein